MPAMPDERVQREGEEAAAGAERGADEQRGEGLAGDRDRGAGDRDGDLGGDAGERGAADDQRGVTAYVPGCGQQVGEDRSGAGRWRKQCSSGLREARTGWGHGDANPTGKVPDHGRPTTKAGSGSWWGSTQRRRDMRELA